MPPVQSGICAQTPVQPHWFAIEPPQVFGALQLPHEMVLPQPSPTWPQVAFWSAQLCGEQPSLLPAPHFDGPPLPHDSPLGQVPH